MRRMMIATGAVALMGLSTACAASDGGAEATTPSAALPIVAVAATQTRAPVTPRCRSVDLRFTVGSRDGAAGSSYATLVMKNLSHHACRSGGYGGVSWVSITGGKQVGAPADRDRSVRAVPFVLIPNAHATATLRMVDAGVYDRSQCQPTDTAGVRIYPPNETHAAFLRLKGVGCANAGVHLLSMRPWQPVR